MIVRQAATTTTQAVRRKRSWSAVMKTMTVTVANGTAMKPNNVLGIDDATGKNNKTRNKWKTIRDNQQEGE